MTEIIKICNLTCGYNGNNIINGINFSIARGSFTGIIGPNGSGKTTLFKAITGDIAITGGEILLNNEKINKLSLKQKAQKIAIVTQNIDAIDIPVEDYVLMGRYPYKQSFQFFETENDYKLARKFMQLTGVYEFKHKLMTEISGGEQQLAAIARALTQEPEILLLDEPTSHLDIHHQMQILNLLQKLNADLKLTILMIIHDLNLSGEFCNYLVMMKQGAVFASGEPEIVLTYKNIEDVYNTVVVTAQNPISEKPIVLLVSDNILKKMS